MQGEKTIRDLYESLIEAHDEMGEGIVILEDEKILFANESLSEITGYNLAELEALPSVAELIAPEERATCLNYKCKHLDSYSTVEHYESALLHKRGRRVEVEVALKVVREDDHTRLIAILRDITERMEAEEALGKSEEWFRTLVQNASDIITIQEADGTIRYKSPAIERILGYEGEELVGTKVFDYVHPDDLDRVKRTYAEQLKSPGVKPPERLRFRHADGSWRHLESVRNNLLDDPSVRGIVVNTRDDTKRKEAEERLEYQAFHDALTDLPNRRLFLDRLGHALARTDREGGSVAVLFVDLDDFKLVNDSLGHDAGNTVLVCVAQRLRAFVRPGDTVGRIFGDEFVVLLEAPSGEKEARRVAERIQESLRAPFNVNGQEVFMKASIGIALSESAEDEPEDLLRRADIAMYVAKTRSKSQPEVYTPSMQTDTVERRSLESSFHKAVEHEEFEIHYQPQVLLENGAITGVEALARWRGPDRSLLAASEFIPLAEETGRITQIGPWVLRESCRQFRDWQERYPAVLEQKVKLCVNLSTREIQHPDLVEEVTGILRETELDPHHLVFEISENTAFKDTEQAICKFRELKDLGVGLALDDFGKGYCSLLYLEHSLLDALKIDRLLMRRTNEDSEKRAAIISALINLGHSLDLEVIVEGVETEEQLEKIKEMGCEKVQGYYFAKPQPVEAVETLFRDGVPW